MAEKKFYAVAIKNEGEWCETSVLYSRKDRAKAELDDLRSEVSPDEAGLYRMFVCRMVDKEDEGGL